MTTLEKARSLDESGNLVEAATKYERAIDQGGVGIDVYLDLAVLYFVLLDPGEAAARHLTEEFLDRAWHRANELLREAESRFGPNSEVEFWKRYFGHVVLGTDAFVDECRDLAEVEESLVPYFYLYAEAGGHAFQAEADRLLLQVTAGMTARARYIKSILESPAIALSRAGQCDGEASG